MTVTDEDRAYIARRFRELKALIQASANKVRIHDSRRNREEPRPDWLRSRPRGSMRCEPGAAIMRSDAVRNFRKEAE